MGQAKNRGSQQERINQAKQNLIGDSKLANSLGGKQKNTNEVKNTMEQTVLQFANELGLPTTLLLEQLRSAGVPKSSVADELTSKDKDALLNYLRKEHGAANAPKNKITLTRRSDNKRTIQVEVRKKTVLARSDNSTEMETVTSSRHELNKNTIPPLDDKESVKKVGDIEVHDLCTRQEDDYFDRKSVRIKPHQLQETAVAFSNAEGGIIVVGIEDDDGSKNPTARWKGKEHIEGYNEIIANLSSLNPSIDYIHQFLYWEGDYSRTYILKLTIRKSQKVHETAKGEVLLRRGAQSLPVRGAKIQELMRAKGVISEEDTTLANIRAEKIIDGDHLRSFLTNLPITNKDPFNFVIQENLLAETMAPSVALVLLFSPNPSADMPRQCAVRIVRYDTSEEEFERDALTKDQHTIEGPLHQQIADAFKKLKEVIGRCKCWTLDGLQVPAYPDEALYELLVNSVLHRDYGVSDNVLISVYRNRVEFRSPGRLPGFVTVKNILDARFSRNPKLVRLLAKYPDAANKDLGEGINTVFERMSKAGFVDPILRDDGVNLYVTLKREPKEDHAGVILKFVEKHGSINNRQALDILALEHSEQATNLFSRMRDQKLLTREDEKQSGIRVQWVKPTTK